MIKKDADANNNYNNNGDNDLIYKKNNHKHQINMAKKFVFNFVFILFLFSIVFVLNLLYAANSSAKENIKSGKYLFNYYSCINCHTINASGGTLGPNLSHYGKSGKKFSWTMKAILNPDRYFKPGSNVVIDGRKYYAIMPKYTYLTGNQVYKIAAYLKSLK
ncbi:MAG: c-type cytochrome [bacterium]